MKANQSFSNPKEKKSETETKASEPQDTETQAVNNADSNDNAEPVEAEVLDMEGYVAARFDVDKQKYVKAAYLASAKDTSELKTIQEWDKIFNNLYNAGV
jgi:hypothetical protein